MNHKNLKQVIISIAVGASISALTALFGELIQWLRQLDPGSIGAGSGMVYHYFKWKINPIG